MAEALTREVSVMQGELLASYLLLPLGVIAAVGLWDWMRGRR